MNTLRAHTKISLPDAGIVVADICDHMKEHGALVSVDGNMTLLQFPNAAARFTSGADRTEIAVEAHTLEELYFARLAISSHIIEFADGLDQQLQWTGDGSEFSSPPNFQVATVRHTVDLTPAMRRMTLACPDVERFVSLDALHLNILVQHPDSATPQWPKVAANGAIAWDDPERRPAYRKYTVRRVDRRAGTIDIDFVMHSDAGPGSGFAETAREGDIVGLVGPGGGGLKPADWYLFAGDETAMPAIMRMLESLPSTASATVIMEIADERERQQLESAAQLNIRWLERDATGTRTGLADAVRSVDIPGDVRRYVWAGCEFEDFREIRRHVRNVVKLSKDEQLIVAYWRKGLAEDAD